MAADNKPVTTTMQPFASTTNRKDFATESLKIPPHSIEAEQSVLGGLMLDNNTWDQVADRLDEPDFYRADHRLIFRAIRELAAKGSPFDVVTLAEWLERNNLLEEAGGFAYLGVLARDTPSAANIQAYAHIVRERSILRQLIEVSTVIANSAYNPQGRDSHMLLDEAEQKVFAIAEQGVRQQAGFISVKELLVKAVERVDMLFQQSDPITGVPTGWRDFDEMTAGLQPGDLIIIAGRPSMGKCIVSGSRLLDPTTGRLRTIDALVHAREGRLVTLDADCRLRPAQPSQFVDDGRKPVFRVRTASGREIGVTLAHPFLGLDGWRPLRELRVGDPIAAPRRLPFFGRRRLPEAQLEQLAYSIAAGYPTPPAAPFSNADSRSRADVDAAARPFPSPGIGLFNADAPPLLSSRASEDSGSCSLAIAAPQPVTALPDGSNSAPARPPPEAFAVSSRDSPTSIKIWSDLSKLCNQDAYANGAPAIVFELEKPQLALFLNRLFACNGRAYMQNERQYGISYACESKALAHDVRHLLLRFGINAELRYRQPDYHSQKHFFQVLSITGCCDILNFIEHIGIPGKEDQLAQLRRLCLSSSSEVELNTLAGEPSDIYWDRITAIEYIGIQQVYDLTVPVTHNFIAEDMLAHNTTFAMNIAENVAIRCRKPVAVFSMEMSAEQLVMRMLSSLGRIEQQRIRTGKLEEADWPRLTSAASMLSDKPLFIDDTPALSPSEVRARARRLQRECGQPLGLILIDYIQLMQVPGTTENRATEVSEISRSLKALAKELRVPVAALSQLNRSLEQRSDKRPIMSDLRESGSLEQDSDLICFIYRDEVYNPDTADKGKAEIIIAKQRNGPIGLIPLTFQGRYTRFDSYISEQAFSVVPHESSSNSAHQSVSLAPQSAPSPAGRPEQPGGGGHQG